MLPYKSPELCARCGSVNVAATWKVSKKTAQFNVRTFLTMCLSFFVSSTSSDSFNVPICNACKGTLEKIQKTTRGITISLTALFGLLFGLVYLVKGFNGSNLAAQLFILVFITLFCALIGAFGGIISGLTIQEAFNYDFCNYDGEYYDFKNKKFRREFAALNPALVKLKKK